MLRFPLISHVPMFGFTVVAFLFVCTILAVATLLVFKSGEKGTTKLGGCAGCAIGFALLAIAGLAALITVGVMLLTARSEIVRNGPIRSLELDLDHDDKDAHEAPGNRGAEPDHGAEESANGETDKSLNPVAPNASEAPSAAAQDAGHAVHLKLVIRGKEYPAAISDWIRDHTDGDVSVTVSHQGDRTIVDLGLPFTRDELKQFKHDMKKSLPDMKLPKGIKVDIKDADD
jgi:hypothetical protein